MGVSQANVAMMFINVSWARGRKKSIYIEIFANVMPGTKLAFMEHFRV